MTKAWSATVSPDTESRTTTADTPFSGGAIHNQRAGPVRSSRPVPASAVNLEVVSVGTASSGTVSPGITNRPRTG